MYDHKSMATYTNPGFVKNYVIFPDHFIYRDSTYTYPWAGNYGGTTNNFLNMTIGFGNTAQNTSFSQYFESWLYLPAGDYTIRINAGATGATGLLTGLSIDNVEVGTFDLSTTPLLNKYFTINTKWTNLTSGLKYLKLYQKGIPTANKYIIFGPIYFSAIKK